MRSGIRLSPQLVVALLAVGACSDAKTAQVTGPGAIPLPRPNASISQPTVGNTVVDGTLEIRLDSLTGELRMKNLSTGQVVYAEPDAEILTGITNYILGARVGDANYFALSSLHPFENHPGGPEPEFVSMELLSGQAWSGSTSKQIGSGGSGQILIRRRPSGTGRTPHTSRISTLNMLAASGAEGEWNPSCPDIAQTIGDRRLSYLQRRRAAIVQLSGVLGVPASRLVWKGGKPYVTLQDLRTIYVTAGVQLLSAADEGLQLDIFRSVYNMNYCEEPIVVQAPHPGAVYVGDGGGSGRTCQTVYLQYEISYDGGATWYPFEVATLSCYEQEE